jgi:hypothetical protein
VYYYRFCCEDNVTFCLYNMPKCFILLRKSQKIFWGGAQPLPTPFPVGRGTSPPHTPPPSVPKAPRFGPLKCNSWIRHCPLLEPQAAASAAAAEFFLRLAVATEKIRVQPKFFSQPPPPKRVRLATYVLRSTDSQ